MTQLNIKLCGDCEQEKTLDNFSLTPAGHPRSICKPCRVKRNKYRFPKEYGISYDDVIELTKAQEYKCAICGTHEKEVVREKLFVDHCHTSGKVRGMLCSKCNTMLGMANDNINILASAISYLKQNND